MSSDFRVPLDPVFSAFGVPVTITRPAPDQTPITTTGVWLRPLAPDLPVGREYQRQEPLRVLSLQRSAVTSLPVGTLIQAPEVRGGPTRLWRHEGLAEQAEADEWRALVIAAGSPA